MREDNFPELVSDPEADGLPGTADDDSTAYDDVESPRVADGPDPAPLPGEVPLAVDRFGTTPEDARLGESVDYKLAREVPDEESDDDEADGETAARDDEDVTPFDAETDQPDLDAGLFDAASPVADGDSEVSVYDVPDAVPEVGTPIGRLVEPDEGAHSDDEPDAVAYDAGAAGGGPSAEELAMHEIPEP
jgi:hypothetical protein